MRNMNAVPRRAPRGGRCFARDGAGGPGGRELRAAFGPVLADPIAVLLRSAASAHLCVRVLSRPPPFLSTRVDTNTCEKTTVVSSVPRRASRTCTLRRGTKVRAAADVPDVLRARPVGVAARPTGGRAALAREKVLAAARGGLVRGPGAPLPGAAPADARDDFSVVVAAVLRAGFHICIHISRWQQRRLGVDTSINSINGVKQQTMLASELIS